MTVAPNESESVVELTLRAVIAGIVFGVLFGAANAYLGLRVGLTVSTSIPIAVLAVAAFKLMPRRGSVILEANISQTIGSASSSLATGTIFTIPALFLWGMAPPFWQVALLALLGGYLGIAAMVPLRRLLIVSAADELPYPEGTACAEVLRATTETADAGGGRWIFIGIAVGAAVKLALGAFMLLPSALEAHLPVVPKAVVALEIAPALLAVGYILGYKQSAIMVSGSLISAIVLTPLIAIYGTGPIASLTASQIWSRHVRFIGAGAVAAAVLVAVARALPTMWRSFAAVVHGLKPAHLVSEEAPTPLSRGGEQQVRRPARRTRIGALQRKEFHLDARRRGSDRRRCDRPGSLLAALSPRSIGSGRGKVATTNRSGAPAPRVHDDRSDSSSSSVR